MPLSINMYNVKLKRSYYSIKFDNKIVVGGVSPYFRIISSDDIILVDKDVPFSIPEQS